MSRVPARPASWLSSLPALQGLLPVRRSLAPRDVLAGVTLSALAVPQALGYAKIAGLPVVTGLYSLRPGNRPRAPGRCTSADVTLVRAAPRPAGECLCSSVGEQVRVQAGNEFGEVLAADGDVPAHSLPGADLNVTTSQGVVVGVI